MKAYQVASQWQMYDDVYRGRSNEKGWLVIKMKNMCSEKGKGKERDRLVQRDRQTGREHSRESVI